jgi:hypothetical protein
VPSAFPVGLEAATALEGLDGLARGVGVLVTCFGHIEFGLTQASVQVAYLGPVMSHFQGQTLIGQGTYLGAQPVRSGARRRAAQQGVNLPEAIPGPRSMR